MNRGTAFPNLYWLPFVCNMIASDDLEQVSSARLQIDVASRMLSQGPAGGDEDAVETGTEHIENIAEPNTNAPLTTMPVFDMPPEVPTRCVAQDQTTLSLFNLRGKTALITGANGGIGGGMARGLAEAGADIVIFQIPGDKSTFGDELSRQTGSKVSVYDCDLSDTSAIRATVKRVLDDGYIVDILCNVAGISSGSIPILHETDEHKDAVS